MEEEIDFTKIRYVLYARKSTDDSSRQLRSLGDQIAECRELAKRLNLNVIGEPIVESISAKRPNQRPAFRKMLNDIRKGLYEGILAWNPDRLARNMKEGGEIIDMIDEGYIQDLKFVTHHFSKDANGKMLLGMAFVLSKQYSDDLSQKVSRGVKRNFAEGKSPAPKHGYSRNDTTGMYEPNPQNFPLIAKAWEMRAEGTSLEDIVKFLQENDYKRQIKSSDRVIKITKQILSDMFQDPFYYGLLIQKGKEVFLPDIYSFEPATTKEVYNQIQALSYRKIKPNKHHKTAFYPLRAMVLCSECGRNMYVGASRSKTGKRYLNYRCDNKACERKKKSIRARVIFDFIYKFLEDGLNFTEKDYYNYYSDLQRISESKREQISHLIHSKTSILTSIKKEKRDLALALVSPKKQFHADIIKINEDKFTELDEQGKQLIEEIEKLKLQLPNPEEEKFTLEEFLNLSKNASVIVQSANEIVKDQICRLIFLNLTVNEEKVLSYQLKEPFSTLLEYREIHSSRGGET